MTRDEIVEAVAEAAWRAEMADRWAKTGKPVHDEFDWDDGWKTFASMPMTGPGFVCQWTVIAQAAILATLRAVREPTDGMLLAVCPNHDPATATTTGSKRRGCSYQVAATSRWQAMLDHLLSTLAPKGAENG